MPTAANLLLELAAHLQAAPPALTEDGQGVMGLEYGDGLTVMLAAEATTLVLYGPVGHVPESQPEILAEVLAANLFWEATRGATLALEPYDWAVVLQRALPVEGLGLQGLEQAVEDFAAQLDQHKTWLAASLQAHEGQPTSPPAVPPAGAIA